MPKFCSADPKEFDSKEIDDFVAFVLAGGEVLANGLRDLVLQASQISFVREGDCLLGVAGLKIPRESYRRRIEKASKTPISAEDFQFELSWVFISPSAQDQKLSFPLCQPLVTAAKDNGIFSTSRTTNEPMHRTLKRLGFNRTGKEWPSKENDGKLALFLRQHI